MKVLPAFLLVPSCSNLFSAMLVLIKVVLLMSYLKWSETVFSDNMVQEYMLLKPKNSAYYLLSLLLNWETFYALIISFWNAHLRKMLIKISLKLVASITLILMSLNFPKMTYLRDDRVSLVGLDIPLFIIYQCFLNSEQTDCKNLRNAIFCSTA